ncbi:hypothetical protein AXF42_Ash016586 [Apostasia shenzhenica]|uniref:Uncharacterized protein n=1 Tax=Apostasia shenzhenica TaxID=1088818 RepID=A0A2I0A1H7_9ASPA|nr:hypothetical protein AXF42_Ash016586 [Apostasia shenzhenica]
MNDDCVDVNVKLAIYARVPNGLVSMEGKNSAQSCSNIAVRSAPIAPEANSKPPGTPDVHFNARINFREDKRMADQPKHQGVSYASALNGDGRFDNRRNSKNTIIMIPPLKVEQAIQQKEGIVAQDNEDVEQLAGEWRHALI